MSARVSRSGNLASPPRCPNDAARKGKNGEHGRWPVASVMPLSIGQHVLVYGWVGRQYRDGVPGTIIRRSVSGVGEWIYSVVLDAPQPDGICLVEAPREDLVNAAAAPPPRRPRRRRTK